MKSAYSDLYLKWWYCSKKKVCVCRFSSAERLCGGETSRITLNNFFFFCLRWFSCCSYELYPHVFVCVPPQQLLLSFHILVPQWICQFNIFHTKKHQNCWATVYLCPETHKHTLQMKNGYNFSVVCCLHKIVWHCLLMKTSPQSTYSAFYDKSHKTVWKCCKFKSSAHTTNVELNCILGFLKIVSHILFHICKTVPTFVYWFGLKYNKVSLVR